MTLLRFKAAHWGLKALAQSLRSANMVAPLSSPILLITSSHGSGDGRGSRSMDDNHQLVVLDTASRHVQFLFQQQLGLRTIPTSLGVTSSSSSLSASFPALEAVQDAEALASRVGATAVAAVGSASAMNLAKALYTNSSSDSNSSGENNSVAFPDLVLIPSTFDACLAATSSHGLVWDVQQEVIVPATNSSIPRPLDDNSNSVVISVPEENLFVHDAVASSIATASSSSTTAAVSRQDSLLAVVALALDRLIQDTHLSSSTPNRSGNTISLPVPATAASSSQAIPLLQFLGRAVELYHAKSTTTKETSDIVKEAAELLLIAGQDLLSFGLANGDDASLRPLRSSPLAVALSLLAAPSHDFASNTSYTTLMASLVPALAQEAMPRVRDLPQGIDDNDENNLSAVLAQIAQLPTPTVVTNESMSALLTQIHDNQLHWGPHCRDVSDDYFRTILRNHLLVV